MSEADLTLLPCPFCGGPAEMEDSGKMFIFVGPNSYRVRCARCVANSGLWQDYQEMAAKTWNLRVEKP